MKAKLSIIGMMICLLFFGCKSEKEQVRDKIRGNEISSDRIVP